MPSKECKNASKSVKTVPVRFRLSKYLLFAFGMFRVEQTVQVDNEIALQCIIDT